MHVVPQYSPNPLHWGCCPTMGRGHWQQNQTRFQIWSWSWWYQVSSKRNSTQTRLWALSISSLLVWPFTKYFNKTNRVSIFHVIIDSVCSDLTGDYVIEFWAFFLQIYSHTKLRSGGMAVVVTGWQPGSGNTNSMRIVKIP